MTSLPPGPVPDTYAIPAQELAALLTDRDRLTRLLAFLGAKTVETSFSRGHSFEYPVPDPWIMGYSIETEHRGCYTFKRLAEGPDLMATLDAGLAAWDARCAEWAEQDDGRDW